MTLSMGVLSKPDGVVNQSQHFTAQHTATPKTKEMFDRSPNIFDRLQTKQSSIELH